jgi:diguanylate cyclase (GGDEF)-like protein
MKKAIKCAPDRYKLVSELKQKIHSAHKNNNLLGLVIVHLLRLREINNEYGYETADLIIHELSIKLESILQSKDIIGRIGGKEFALILSSLKGPGQCVLAANRILELCNTPLNINGHLIKIKLAIGISIFPDNGQEHEELMKQADLAVIYARESQDGYMLFSDVPESANNQEYVMRTELEKAISNNQLKYFYQPKINVKDRSISGFEVLSRWTSENLGNINPDVFIDLAETTGQITPLTVKVVTTTLRQFKDIQKIDDKYSLSLNISALTLNDSEATELLINSVVIWCPDLSRLTLEITEGAIMTNPETSLNTLKFMHESGIKISIDDFGTGYSSLVYLKKLPVSELKIDRSFVHNMITDNDDANIVKAVIDLGHDFNLEVVAEGVENEEILNELEKMSCDVAQGYYIAQPMSYDELIPWIKAWNNKYS